MCGLAGVVARAPLTPAQDAAVAHMLARSTHRGPDDTGVHRDLGFSVGVARLAVVDPAGSRQPIFNEDGSLALVLNGEIYNHLDLRRALSGGGHRFATAGDAEAVVHLYEEHGLDFVRHLRGMFALALWDARRRRLVLARDRMGEKPLYLCERGGALYFASEMKALLAGGQVAPELEPDAVHAYLHLGYVPEPGTALREVRKLPAASMVVVDADAGSHTQRTYWRMEDAAPRHGEPGPLIREELERVSALVVRSDVPVGVALSGGIDSSAVAVLAARARPGGLQAFGVGYPGAHEFDERREAEELCARIGIAFHGVEVGVEEMTDFFPELVFWRDDPIADWAGHGYYALMRAADEAGVRVMLQGQGADELFWGYDWVRDAARRTRDLEAAEPAAERMVLHDGLPGFAAARERLPVHYTPGFLARIDPRRLYEPWSFPRPWPSIPVTMTRLVCESYLVANGVAQNDRLGMARSVELRLPFLDHELVETVIGLRKVSSDLEREPKAWLREALRGVLPEDVRSRPKRAFTAPVDEWRRSLFARYKDTLRDGFLVRSGVLDGSTVGLLARDDGAGGPASPLFFRMLVLETWCRGMQRQTMQD
jgi:asparagine synthase (glutamine-hydrolysing)